MINYESFDLEKIQNSFLVFAESECKGNSELYYKLSKEISKDKDLAKIASFTKYNQPIPNIFLASVHYLLLKNTNEQLSNYYPSITNKNVSEIPFDLFKSFCMRNQIKIKELISTKIVQTNVINRCSYLMPIFSKLIQQEDREATIIDIGASACLNLHFDKYEYWYNNKKYFGDSNVKIFSQVINSEIKKIYKINNKITKIGIDQNIIDLTNQDEKLWLKALIWADQLERFISFDESLRIHDLDNFKQIKSESILDFEKIIENIDYSQNLIIYSTHTLYQFTEIQRQNFYQMLNKIGEKRDFYFISVEKIKHLLEKYDTNNVVIELTSYKNKNKNEKILAETNGHGNWIKWKE